MSRNAYIILLIIISTVVFHGSTVILRSNLYSPYFLSKELKTTEETLYEWNRSNEAPFKYRILFKNIVEIVWKVASPDRTNQAFFYAYKASNNIFYVSTILLFFILLVRIDLNPNEAFIGSLILMSLPPFLMAFSPPVHTREDMLGYTILLVGIFCIINKQGWWLLPISVLGVLCRETLLILPLLYVFYGTDKSFIVRVSILSASLITFILVRLLIGYEYYNPFEGMQWNIANPEQVIGFLFLTFGFLWLPFLNKIFTLRSYVNNQFISKSSRLALIIIITTTFIGGIFNEIRLAFLLFPWVALESYSYMVTHMSVIEKTFKKKSYQTYLLIVIIIFLPAALYFYLNYQDFITPSKFSISMENWIILTLFNLLLMAIFAPIFIRIEIMKHNITP